MAATRQSWRQPFALWLLLFTLFSLSVLSRSPREYLRTRDIKELKAHAVTLSLNDFFSGDWSVGEWSDGVVFIQHSPYVPAEIGHVGEYEAEVVCRTKLEGRFAGRRFGPSLATVRIYPRRGESDSIQVSVIYTGIQIPGAEGWQLGGQKVYTYTVMHGRLRLTQVDQYFF